MTTTTNTNTTTTGPGTQGRDRQGQFTLDPDMVSPTTRAQHLIAEFLASKSAVPNPMEIAAMAIYATEAGGVVLGLHKNLRPNA